MWRLCSPSSWAQVPEVASQVPDVAEEHGVNAHLKSSVGSGTAAWPAGHMLHEPSFSRRSTWQASATQALASGVFTVAEMLSIYWGMDGLALLLPTSKASE
mmetsp:Transcript_8634/g.14857  ORF Transcript_8634/g.14857 Transcript_8634/m.14857 type:complete len:101 (+) Transcript_8634:2283-2585(+)